MDIANNKTEMRLTKNITTLTSVCILLFTPTTIFAQGTEIAMERLSEMFRLIGNIALTVALINFLLLISYLLTKKSWLTFPIIILSIPCLLFGLAAYHDDPWIAKTTLLSGLLPILVLILRKIFKARQEQ
ncbi:MAG: hypothetical protein JNM51_00075 [Bacteroidia bacterium]|nr:hypothetical protein [Bacteroidia bacterium]